MTRETTEILPAPYLQIDALESDGDIMRILALDTETGRSVMIKGIPLHGDPELERRLRRRAMILEGTPHPHLVRCYSHWVQDDIFFFAHEQVRGQTLASFAGEVCGTPPHAHVKQILGIFESVAWAMHALHAAGIALGRLTPSMIVIEPNGNPKVNYTGLVPEETNAGRMERLIARPPTLAAVAPEERHGARPDVSTDIFALGAAMYTIFAGRLPGLRFDPEVTLDAPSRFNPAVSAELDAIILRAMQYDRTGRFQSARDLARHLSPFKQECMVIRMRPAVAVAA